MVATRCAKLPIPRTMRRGARSHGPFRASGAHRDPASGCAIPAKSTPAYLGPDRAVRATALRGSRSLLSHNATSTLRTCWSAVKSVITKRVPKSKRTRRRSSTQDCGAGRLIGAKACWKSPLVECQCTAAPKEIFAALTKRWCTPLRCTSGFRFMTTWASCRRTLASPPTSAEKDPTQIISGNESGVRVRRCRILLQYRP